MSLAADKTESLDHGRIPVLDIGAYLAGEAGAAAPLARAIARDNPPKYEPTTYGAFTQHLLNLNFAHRQADGSENA